MSMTAGASAQILRLRKDSPQSMSEKRPRGRPRKLRNPAAPHPRQLQVVLGERLSESVAAAWFRIPLREVRAVSRGSARVADARQIGMYLAHIVFRRSLTRVGHVFGRDRTTVRHACARIEDWRDRPVADRAIEQLTLAVARWSEGFATRLAGDRGAERS